MARLVEICTRVSVAPMLDDHGVDREALDSLYKLFGIVRQVMVDAGPDAARASEAGASPVAVIGVALNYVLRPFLARWHPLLRVHEEQRAEGAGVVTHERTWDRHDELRTELFHVQLMLAELAGVLARILRVDAPASLLIPG